MNAVDVPDTGKRNLLNDMREMAEHVNVTRFGETDLQLPEKETQTFTMSGESAGDGIG